MTGNVVSALEIDVVGVVTSRVIVWKRAGAVIFPFFIFGTSSTRNAQLGLNFFNLGSSMMESV